MGMTIDDCIKIFIAKEKCMKRETSGIDTDCNLHNCDDCSLCYEQGNIGEQKMALLFAVDAMRQYQLMQADYKTRLKADMVAMLTEIQSEIRHFMYDVNPSSSESDYACNYMIDSIQQRINALKAESEDE